MYSNKVLPIGMNAASYDPRIAGSDFRTFHPCSIPRPFHHQPSSIKKTMNLYAKLGILSVASAALALHTASAQVVGVDLGTGLPPATLGGYTMNPFDPGSITGAQQGYEMDGSGAAPEDIWATWGQDYTGHVYVVDDSGSPGFSDTLDFTLSGGVHAVYFYEEPNQFLDFTMTATDSSGVSVSTVINGYHGSSAVGFYEMDPSDTLSSITVTASDPTGFAIGEFGVDEGRIYTQGVPDVSSTVVLLGLGLVGLVALRRRLLGTC